MGDKMAAEFDMMTAIFLKGHLKLMAVGMSNSRVSKTEMLKKATDITGKVYKRTEAQRAFDDVAALILEKKNA
jgi:hypothetical protein